MGFTQPPKGLEKSLKNVCEQCFTEGFIKSFSKEDQFWLDAARGSSKADLDLEAAKVVQEKYQALFSTCTDRLLKFIDGAKSTTASRG